jgi:hypothetical protein
MVYATFRGETDPDGVLVPYEIVMEVVDRLDHQDLDELLPFPATGENLAAWIAGELKTLIETAGAGYRVCLSKVELHEDPSPVPHVVVWTP